MEIDIDSFLNSHSKEEKKVENEKIDLSFQKEVEDKLDIAQKSLTKTNYNFLKEAYTEVKKFDEDLPNKFLGIENKSDEVLKQLGDKYSQDFVLRVNSNMQIIEMKISKYITEINLKINEENFIMAIQLIEKSLKELESIPKHFLIKKSKLSIEIRKIEISLNKKIEEFKLNKLKEIKLDLNKKILELKKCLNSDNLDLIEDKINELNHLSIKIPKIFLSEFTNEKNLINKTLIDAQNYLFSEQKKDFITKKKNIEVLTEKYLKLKMGKNIDELLIVYSEIIYEFQNMPEVFFEEKITVFREINQLYGSINSLIIKNNLTTFYNTYNYGKMFEEIKEYFEHISKTKKINEGNLLKIKNKLEILPTKYDFEKKDLMDKLNYFLDILKKNEDLKKSMNQKNTENNLDKSKINVEKNKNYNEFYEEIDISKLNVGKNIKEEINLYYIKLQRSNNPKELKIFYNKLIFYLKLANIDENVRKNIIIDLNRIINSKKFS